VGCGPPARGSPVPGPTPHSAMAHGPASPTEHPLGNLGRPTVLAAAAAVQKNPFHRAPAALSLVVCVRVPRRRNSECRKSCVAVLDPDTSGGAPVAFGRRAALPGRQTPRPPPPQTNRRTSSVSSNKSSQPNELAATRPVLSGPQFQA
jgi:hypothetical protein